MNKNCYRCEVQLTRKNSSNEHVIINACGGRLKSRNLLCVTCNSVFGESFDRALADSTNDLANLLLIKRQRGKPQPIKGSDSKTGKDWYYDYDGILKSIKPEVEESLNKNILSLGISANNERQFSQILQGLKKRYPGIDTDLITSVAQEKKKYLEDSISIKTNIGGNKVFKSIAKTAINYFILNNGDSSYIKHLLPYFESENEIDAVRLYYPSEYPYSQQDGEVTHILRLVGDSNKRILYCYIELFNVHIFVVKLNENYLGLDLSCQYVLDVLNSEEIIKGFPSDLSRKILLDLFEIKNYGKLEIVERRYNRVLKIADSRQVSHHRSKLISKGINTALKNVSEGQVLDSKLIKKIVDEVMKELTPFLIHRNKIQNDQNI